MESWKEIRWFLELAIIYSPSTGNTDSGTARFENEICVGMRGYKLHQFVLQIESGNRGRQHWTII